MQRRQRQRIAIARALVRQLRLVICDEPVSALGLTTQATMIDPQRALGTAYRFISHGLALVRRNCHRVAVMRHGRIVETGPGDVMTRAPCILAARACFWPAPPPTPPNKRGVGPAGLRCAIRRAPGLRPGREAPRCRRSLPPCAGGSWGGRDRRGSGRGWAVDLIGYSLGARPAWALAVRHPGRVGNLAPFDPVAALGAEPLDPERGLRSTWGRFGFSSGDFVSATAAIPAHGGQRPARRSGHDPGPVEGVSGRRDAV